MRIEPVSLLFCATLLLGACSSSNSTTDSAVGDSTGTTAGETVNESTNGADEGNTASPSTNNTMDTGGDTASENGDASTDAGASTADVQNGTDTGAEQSESFADYRITFDGTWSADTHNTLFPANAHFSGLVGAVHNDQVVFWEPGQIASDGIELMAETGGKSIFLQEIESAINSGYALSAIDGPGIATSPGSASIEIRVTVDNPLVTLTTMLAPSPDWFAGFHGIRLYDGESFVQSISIDGVVYDSGTDSGPQYTSGDSDTQPREPIARTTSNPADSPFVDGLPIAGRFIIEKL